MANQADTIQDGEQIGQQGGNQTGRLDRSAGFGNGQNLGKPQVLDLSSGHGSITVGNTPVVVIRTLINGTPIIPSHGLPLKRGDILTFIGSNLGFFEGMSFALQSGGSGLREIFRNSGSSSSSFSVTVPDLKEWVADGGRVWLSSVSDNHPNAKAEIRPSVIYSYQQDDEDEEQKRAAEDAKRKQQGAEEGQKVNRLGEVMISAATDAIGGIAGAVAGGLAGVPKPTAASATGSSSGGSSTTVRKEVTSGGGGGGGEVNVETEVQGGGGTDIESTTQIYGGGQTISQGGTVTAGPVTQTFTGGTSSVSASGNLTSSGTITGTTGGQVSASRSGAVEVSGQDGGGTGRAVSQNIAGTISGSASGGATSTAGGGGTASRTVTGTVSGGGPGGGAGGGTVSQNVDVSQSATISEGGTAGGQTLTRGQGQAQGASAVTGEATGKISAEASLGTQGAGGEPQTSPAPGAAAPLPSQLNAQASAAGQAPAPATTAAPSNVLPGKGIDGANGTPIASTLKPSAEKQSSSRPVSRDGTPVGAMPAGLGNILSNTAALNRALGNASQRQPSSVEPELGEDKGRPDSKKEEVQPGLARPFDAATTNGLASEGSLPIEAAEEEPTEGEPNVPEQLPPGQGGPEIPAPLQMPEETQTPPGQEQSNGSSSEPPSEENQEGESQGPPQEGENSPGQPTPPPVTPRPGAGAIDDAAVQMAIKRVNNLVDAYLMEGVILVWSSAFFTVLLSVLAGAILGDFLWLLKDRIVKTIVGRIPAMPQAIKDKVIELSKQITISRKIKINIVAMNFVVIAVPSFLILMILFVGCNYPTPNWINSKINYRTTVVGAFIGDQCQIFDISNLTGSFASSQVNNAVSSSIGAGPNNCNQKFGSVVPSSGCTGSDCVNVSNYTPTHDCQSYGGKCLLSPSAAARAQTFIAAFNQFSSAAGITCSLKISAAIEGSSGPSGSDCHFLGNAKSGTCIDFNVIPYNAVCQQAFYQAAQSSQAVSSFLDEYQSACVAGTTTGGNIHTNF